MNEESTEHIQLNSQQMDMLWSLLYGSKKGGGIVCNVKDDGHVSMWGHSEQEWQVFGSQ